MAAQPSQLTLPPRRNALPTPASAPPPPRPRPRSPLETLLQMGFSQARAQKALVWTGGRGVQIASDWLLAHVSDPLIDTPSPRHYVLYLCPSSSSSSSGGGVPLTRQLQTFWDASHVQIGWNGAHNSFPHVTLTATFVCHDHQVDEVIRVISRVSDDFRPDFVNCCSDNGGSAGGLTLEKYASPNFFGLFVGKREEILLRSFSQALTQALADELSLAVEPASTQAFHVTLAYQFAPEHFAGLQDLAQAVDPRVPCDWDLRLYSFEERLKGQDVFKVLFAHVPRAEDELELMIGDLVYVSPDEMAAHGDGWVRGTSWLTGCSGYLPKNYIQQTAETNAWTLHLSVGMTSAASETSPSRRSPVASSDVSGAAASLLMLSSTASSSSLERLKGSCGSLIGRQNEAVDGRSTAADPETASKRAEEKAALAKDRTRRVFIVRHGERVDFTFGTWLPFCIDEQGRYSQKDLNMPLSLPARRSAGGGSSTEGFARDCPLTRIGQAQARMLGEAMRESGQRLTHAYCSPSLRCVQTCHEILLGMGLQKDIKIHLEPGLFEWLAWYQNIVPDWMSPEELTEAGFNIDAKYKPYIAADELQDTTQESCEQYYTRNFFVTRCILQATENAAAKDDGGGGERLLFVGHASTLDACTRQICGLTPRGMHEMCAVVQKVPYCSMAVMEEQQGGGGGAAADVGADTATDAQSKRARAKRKSTWKLVEPPVAPMTHCSNSRFDWNLLTDNGNSSNNNSNNHSSSKK